MSLLPLLHLASKSLSGSCQGVCNFVCWCLCRCSKGLALPHLLLPL